MANVVELKVGLHCDECIKKILKAIKKIEADIETYNVDTQLNKVIVTGNVTTEEDVKEGSYQKKSIGFRFLWENRYMKLPNWFSVDSKLSSTVISAGLSFVNSERLRGVTSHDLEVADILIEVAWEEDVKLGF
ncbi:hypothetical protein EZV62_025900 [Acer yangbiense]|uniref:HMA domain-containing protein n=1 Tax=Acer yangbiense TaxID=1000413 RepID=A0A5C7GZV5_9ROSI|nr:hypothetical protein EZV62_025900 [Acer yangbiense]